MAKDDPTVNLEIKLIVEFNISIYKEKLESKRIKQNLKQDLYFFL